MTDRNVTRCPQCGAVFPASDTSCPSCPPARPSIGPPQAVQPGRSTPSSPTTTAAPGCLVALLLNVLVVLGIGLLVVLGIGLYSIHEELEQTSELKPFGSMSQYVNISHLQPLRHDSRPYVKPKILIVDKKEMGIARLHSQLPTGVRATKKEDVGTVILIERSHLVHGSYYATRLHGGERVQTAYDAVTELWTIWIIDYAASVLAEKREFHGLPPPNEVYDGGAHVYVKNEQGKLVELERENFILGYPRMKILGKNPSREVMNYILQLSQTQATK